MKVVSSALWRAAEAEAMAAGSATVEGLMGEAVSGCLDFLKSRTDLPRRVLVLAGKGHNGNDALLLASGLRARGWRVETVLSSPPGVRTPVDWDGVNREALSARVWPDRPELEGDWVVVDGLLGSGVAGAPRGAVAEMLRWVNGAAWRGVGLALDFPSGLDPDSGVVADPCFTADWTLALGAVKPGCLVDAARGHVGRVVAVPLPLSDPSAGTPFILPSDPCPFLRPVPADLHKYRKGELVIWAGSPGMPGAAILAARAALRAGAGVVRVFTHAEVLPVIASSTPEIMVEPIDPARPLPARVVHARVILAGPGVGRDAGAARLLGRLVEETRARFLFDADALHLLAAEPSLIGRVALPPAVFTPHSGELAALLGETPGERGQAVENWGLRHPATVLVAKGPNTIVRDSGGGMSFNGTGHPGMATAGMGDVLAGVVAALMSRGWPPEVAARFGVCWHGRAAERAVAPGAELLLTAGDVIEALPGAWLEMGRRDVVPDRTRE